MVAVYAHKSQVRSQAFFVSQKFGQRNSDRNPLLENCFFQSFVSIGVHSWFGKYDIVKLISE